MKKFLIFTITLILTICFASCGSSGSSSTNGSSVTGSVEVGVKYIGTAADSASPGDKKIYLYLYKDLSASAQAEPDYTACSDTVVTSGIESIMTIDNIIPGDYYVVIFYDYKNDPDNKASEGDTYSIWGGDRYAVNAEKITVSAGTTPSVYISTELWEAYYKLGPNGIYNVPSVIFNVTYNGSLKDSINPGTEKIYVFVESTTLGTTVPSSSSHGGGGLVAIGEQRIVAIGGIPDGNYKVVIIYDYKKSNTNLNDIGEGDRYVIYDNTNLPAGADNVSITSGVINTISISFDNTYILGADGSWMP